MKKMRRFAAIAAAAAMTACMAVPMTSMFTASAASITINDNGDVVAANHTFAAYQIFTGTLNTAANGFQGSAVEWGSAITDVDGFITALQAANFTGDGVNDAMDGLTATTNTDTNETQSTAYQVALAIEKASSADDAELLADTINTFLGSSTTTTGTYANGTISGLADGYYFVKDTTANIGESDAYSKFILKVAGDVDVDIKTDAPKLVKKIWHNDGTNAAVPSISTTTAPTYSDDLTTLGWNDVGDNQIGDTVYYFIETTVPDMSDYDTYSYVISDMFDTGLTFGEVTKIVYVPASGEGKDISGTTGITIGTDYTGTTEAESFYVDFGDLKTVLTTAGITPGADDKIYTYYTATLNENALVSDTANNTQGNKNTAWLNYSNNPNGTGTGTTAKDTVYDWTYTFAAEKVDEKGDPLGGATFNLTDAAGNAYTLVEVTELTNTNISSKADDTKYYRIAKTGERGVTDITTTDTVNKFVFLGLDDTKTYKLEETVAPTNYTKTEDPAQLIISNAYSTGGAKVDTISREVDGDTADVAKIVNNKGTSLPSTGGIGTTLFYVIGGTLAAGAGVALIAKKRMKNED